ncbi:MAG: helix-turn-helix domain-containing protein [Candidatus Peregrinibacteria bacterium]
MENELLQVLTHLGLTEKEAKVYLSSTEVGTAPVSTIAQKAGINRVTTYDILEKLKQKGLVSYFTKKKIRYFTSTKPETLLEEFEKRTNDLRTSLPKFKRLTGETSHPRVRYFEGLEGIKAIYADTLTSKSEILNYSNSHEIRKQWPNYDKEYVAKRAKKKIFLRGICPKDAEGKIVHKEDEKYHREMRLVPPEQFSCTNEINIYDDKVSIISFKDELIGMIIESSEIANSQRAIFNICWQFAEIMTGTETTSGAETTRGTDIKNKMLEPITGKELKKAIQKTMDSAIKTNNMSLF